MSVANEAIPCYTLTQTFFLFLSCLLRCFACFGYVVFDPLLADRRPRLSLLLALF
ncbi:hypothetical protein HMPREF0973_02062 [Prevotella veroralis F0319]|uniref:Uncharacterized protein n=1 Tax=Prevotella veroralis F0319 TaxID=649761 RepID=C9MR27_9BACT|nr:hypothetical protein HMPREF0973_02062 [Prevotella veroralis F0319]